MCQDLASIETACKCLASSGTAIGLDGAITCEPSNERGTQGQVVVLREQPADPDNTAGGTALVLIVKRGASWSALQVIDRADDVDFTETPNATHTARVLVYEERGSTIWSRPRTSTRRPAVASRTCAARQA